MSWANELMRGGAPVLVLLGVTPLALGLGVAALAVHDRAWRRRVGMAALAMAVLSSSLGLWGALRIRRAPPADAFASHTEWVHARRAAVVGSRGPLEVALAASLIPLLGGLSAVFPGGARRRGGPRSRRALSRRSPGPASRSMPELPAGAFRAAMALGLLALATTATAGGFLIVPAPGPPIPLDSPLWRGLAGAELLEAGSASEGCHVLETSGIRAETSTARAVEVEAALAECFQLRLDEALQTELPEQIAQLEALASSALTRSATDRLRVGGELARARRALGP